MTQRRPRQRTPKASRPDFAPGYGVPKTAQGLKPWSWVTERFTTSRNYWIGSTRPDGAPHVAPVWGLWLDGAFYFSTDRKSRKGMNLAQNPRVVVHLESGDEVCILEGTVEEVRGKAALKKVVEAYAKKYDMNVQDFSKLSESSVMYVVRPLVAFAWLESDYVGSATRWTFGK